MVFDGSEKVYLNLEATRMPGQKQLSRGWLAGKLAGRGLRVETGKRVRVRSGR